MTADNNHFNLRIAHRITSLGTLSKAAWLWTATENWNCKMAASSEQLLASGSKALQDVFVATNHTQPVVSKHWRTQITDPNQSPGFILSSSSTGLLTEGASSQQRQRLWCRHYAVIARVHPVHLMNADWALDGRQLWNQASQFDAESADGLPPSASTIAIYYHYPAWKLALPWRMDSWVNLGTAVMVSRQCPMPVMPW